MSATTAVAAANGPPAGLVPSAENVERTLVRGDLSALSHEERILYLRQVCASLGLNPLTGPFEYVNLGGKLRLYARKDAADQLRKIHGVNVEVVSREVVDDCLVVHVRATMPGADVRPSRTDEDLGVVFLGKLAGENRANAIMRAITKAKRRVTLSICGLGFLDDSEVADVPKMRQQQTVATQHVVQSQPAALPAPTQSVSQAVSQPDAQPAPDKTTDAQLASLRKFKDALQIDGDTWVNKILAKRGVTTARDLTVAQADELAKALQYKLSCLDMERDSQGQPAPLHVSVPAIAKDNPQSQPQQSQSEVTGEPAQPTFPVS